MTALPDDLLRLLAEDARAVFWWAFRMRMPRAQQIEEVEKAFKKRLEDFPDPLLQGATAGAPANQASITAVQNDEGSHDLVGQGGQRPERQSAKSKQQSGVLPQVGNEPESDETPSATNSQIEPDVADPATADARLDLARAH